MIPARKNGWILPYQVYDCAYLVFRLFIDSTLSLCSSALDQVFYFASDLGNLSADIRIFLVAARNHRRFKLGERGAYRLGQSLALGFKS